MKIDKSWIIHGVVWTFLAGGGWFMLKDTREDLKALQASALTTSEKLEKYVLKEDYKEDKKSIWAAIGRR